METPAQTPRGIHSSMFSSGWMGNLNKPGENVQIWPELMDEHLRATGILPFGQDSSEDEFVLNRVVGLKQDAGF